MLTLGEYTDSGVGSELETKCDIRNEEADADSDTESTSLTKDTFTNNENKISGDYSVSFSFSFLQVFMKIRNRVNLKKKFCLH